MTPRSGPCTQPAFCYYVPSDPASLREAPKCPAPRRERPAAPEPLTIKAPQLGGQRGLQGPAAVQERRLQLGAAAVGQVLLHLAGAAGVALGADPQVLTCGEGLA